MQAPEALPPHRLTDTFRSALRSLLELPIGLEVQADGRLQYFIILLLQASLTSWRTTLWMYKQQYLQRYRSETYWSLGFWARLNGKRSYTSMLVGTAENLIPR